MTILLTLAFIIIGAYPLSMLLTMLIMSGGAIRKVKGWPYVLIYWASLVVLAAPFVAIEYARAQ